MTNAFLGQDAALGKRFKVSNVSCEFGLSISFRLGDKYFKFCKIALFCPVLPYVTLFSFFDRSQFLFCFFKLLNRSNRTRPIKFHVSINNYIDINFFNFGILTYIDRYAYR